MIYYWKQIKSLAFHKWHVFMVGLMIGGIPLWRLVVHDWSKFMPVEFVGYAKYKYGQEKSRSGWARAWLSHRDHNKHHPERWLLSWLGDPNFYDGIGERVTDFITVMPMPETYAREWVADMMATSRQFGSYNIAKWLNENGPRMRLHSLTITRLGSVMREVGYVQMNNCDWSWIAGRDVTSL